MGQLFQGSHTGKHGACCGAKEGHRRGAVVAFLLQTNETNRNSRKSGLDEDWAAHVNSLLHYALTLFSAQVLLVDVSLDLHLDNQSPPICTPTTSFPEFSLQSGVGNTTLMGEQASGEAPHQRTFCYTSVASQDDDRKPWGGASSKLGAVASLYACAGGPEWYGSMGLRNAGVCSV